MEINVPHYKLKYGEIYCCQHLYTNENISCYFIDTRKFVKLVIKVQHLGKIINSDNISWETLPIVKSLFVLEKIKNSKISPEGTGTGSFSTQTTEKDTGSNRDSNEDSIITGTIDSDSVFDDYM